MINPGIINRLEIERETDNGLYLKDSEGNEVLLPKRYIPTEPTAGWAIGDSLDVFVYFDSEDRIVATVETPKLMVGAVAALTVAGTTRFGAFMDWGLSKDLFVPLANQPFPMHTGEKHMVGVYVDRTTNRLVGSTKIGKYFSNDTIEVKPRETVQIRVAQRRDRGYRVIVNEMHWGMLYDNQIFTPIEIGDVMTAYVLKITEDGRIDVSLQRQGFEQVKVASDVVLDFLKENGGRIEIGDKTAPEIVQAQIGMSKKVFKKSVGHLMREGLVRAGAESTELIEK